MSFKFVPTSLAARTSLFLLVVIVVAQVFSGAIWYQQSNKKDQEGLINTVHSLALSASSTISFFQSLPAEYRHLVLNQLRSMGGTRFFVSLNTHSLPIKPLPDSERKALVINHVRQVLEDELTGPQNIQLEFTQRQDLKVFNKELPIDELPLLWAHYSLSYGDINPPILVMQIEVADDQWFYLAAVLPAPYVNLETELFTIREVITILFSALLLLVCTWFVVRKEIRPIRNLAKAATLMSGRLKVPQVTEEGSAELRAAIHAFNKMNRRVESHIKDREMLFGAISHDLKTPIACLKLRAEMLDDDVDRVRFVRIANDLDLMVKGALQCIKETDIHEEIESIDMSALVDHAIQSVSSRDDQVRYQANECAPYAGKPLALKRCIQNLIDNGIKYGDSVTVNMHDSPQALCIQVTDDGTGLEAHTLERLFEPYYRQNPEGDKEGTGLGLTISQSIAKSHGGLLELSLTEQGGLSATLIFPRDE